jgi:hypothetical protein
MGRQKSRRSESAHLRRLESRFQAWRKTRVLGERIPEPLWQAAAKVAADVGVGRAASALKLDYYALQRRMPTRQADTAPTVRFVELPSAPLLPSSECTIEIDDGTGASMRIQIKGADLADIASLGHRLWKEE